MSFATLPIELVDCILQYDGRMKYRNGKFMTQLIENPELVTQLNAIPKKRQYFSGKSDFYWNSIVEIYVLNSSTPVSVTKFVLEYNNYSADQTSNLSVLLQEHMPKSYITYLFYCKPAIGDMYCIHHSY
jgi:hypothetical protein